MSRTKAGYIVDDFSGATDNGYGNLTHQKLSPIQAIRHYCWACQGGHEFPWAMLDGKVDPPKRPYPEVRDCPSTTCYLWPFRTGRNPYSTRKGNTDALKKHRESQADTA